MADTDSETLAKLMYYSREHYYRHVYKVAQDGMKKYGNDAILKFFSGWSATMEGQKDRVQLGIRELETIKDKVDVSLCSVLALIQAHKKSTFDEEAMKSLEAKLKTDRKQAGEKALYFGGLFLFLNDKPDKAREYVDRAFKINPESKEILILKGWIELTSGKGIKESVRYFDQAMKANDTKEVYALLGRAKYFELQQNFKAALEGINKAVVAFPSFHPALLEKMRIQLALKDWDQTMETVRRALSADAYCLEAKRYQILHHLWEGNASEAASKIADLYRDLERLEPANWLLYYESGRLFSRLCGRQTHVLQQTQTLIERAVQLQNEADVTTELGYQFFLQNRIRDAIKCFQSAAKADASHVPAFIGLVRCQLSEDMVEEAKEQLEILKAVQSTSTQSLEFMLLSAVLSRKRNTNTDRVMETLENAGTQHLNSLANVPLSIGYYIQLNPELLLELIKEMMMYAPSVPPQHGQPASPVLNRCTQLLEPVARHMPGLLEAYFLLGRIKFLSGDFNAAKSTLAHCIEVDNSFPDAHLLMAQIQLYLGNYKEANHSLETGLSYNFDIKDHPVYHLIKARILKKQGDHTEALKTLQVAMSLPGVQKAGRTASGRKSKVKDIGTTDRVSVFLELAEVHRLCGQQHEAAKIMQDALNEFAGTPEEMRINISNVDLALTRGDVDGALNMLRSIAPGQPYYVQSREKMAEIYLNHRKDRRLYVATYRELAEKNPSPHTSLMLGDAYMGIQEPEKAIEAYEAALRKNPRDVSVAAKLGLALVKTHNYINAINYYESSIKAGQQNHLRYDLADLLMRLRKYDKAAKVLNQALEQDRGGSDLQSLQNQSRAYLLIGKLYMKEEKHNEAMEEFLKAQEVQNKVLKRIQLEQPDAMPQQKKVATEICLQMAELATAIRDFAKAIKYYKEALIYCDSDPQITFELAKLYLLMNDLDQGQAYCASLLKEDKTNPEANIMMADLLFRKQEYDTAIFHVKQILDKNPNHYEALAKYVDILRRSGHMEDIPKSFTSAEATSQRTVFDAGFNFAKGLYEWYTGHAAEALKFFNKARKDAEWGYRSTIMMIEICLNPDSEVQGGEVFENTDDVMPGSEGENLGIKTAEKLLKELKPKGVDLRPRLLQNFYLLATKSKTNVETALRDFQQVAALDPQKENIGAMLGAATAYMIQKQAPKARGELKQVHKSQWTPEDADYLERCWLLAADINIQSAKYDVATELLKRCLQYNQACCKAYEYQGFINEKEQLFQPAAKNYELAWKYSNKSNPAIGYKLSFNYLKSKRYVEAIDVCHQVLKEHPDYPKIKKDVLEKARLGIRT